MHQVLRRGAVLTVAAALTATTLTGAPADARAAKAAAPSRAELAADWLTRQLTDGVVHNGQFDFDDYGLTIDVALALDAMGGNKATVKDIRSAVATGIGGYISGDGTGDPGSTYAGATAKALVLAQTGSGVGHSFGGVDLVDRLESVVATDAPVTGRIADVSGFGDFANVLGQAYAVRSLARAGSTQAQPALDFLLEQQCSEGYFRLNFTADKGAADQTCDGGDDATTSAPDTDATAVALISLEALGSDDANVTQAIRAGVAWLKDTQRANGSFGGGTSTEGVNSNSTGLAAWALAGDGSCGAAVDAATWVTRLQVVKPAAGSKLRKQKGAIAYNGAALAAGRQDGIPTAKRDQWRRASAQAAPAMDLLTAAACRRF
ncbi:MAG: hypothetical protein U0R80_10160 [Nocardioidaceae bacterium]